MKKFMIDSNILLNFEKLVNEGEESIYPEWRETIKYLWNANLNNEVELYLPKQAWTENLGASEDADLNARIIYFTGKYFSDRIIPKNSDNNKDLDHYKRYLMAPKLFKPRSKDDMFIAAQCAVCNMDLITYNSKDFGKGSESPRAKAIAEFNESFGYHSKPISPEEAVELIREDKSNSPLSN